MSFDVIATDSWADELIRSISAYRAEIARQRSKLRAAWLSLTAEVDRIQAQIRALEYALERRTSGLTEVTKNFGVQPDTGRIHPIPAATTTAWLQPNGNNNWTLRPYIERDFDADHAEARAKLIEARNRIFGGGAQRAGALALGRFSARLSRLREVKSQLDAALSQAIAARSAKVSSERAAADQALALTAAMTAQALKRLPPQLQPWDSAAWGDWSPPAATCGLGRVYAGTLAPVADGDLGENASFATQAEVPLLLSLQQNLQVAHNDADRGTALGFVRSILLRELAAVPPGELQFCLFDPIGLGQSAGNLLDMAEYDAAMIGGKVWSTAADLASRLTEQTNHIELIIQKYLRTTYDTIDDFNAAAGEIAEPYRLLVLFDFPTGFSEQTLGQLKSIMENGPRCGVFTVLLHNTSVTPGYGVDLGQLPGGDQRMNLNSNFTDEHRGYLLRMRLRPESDSRAADTLINNIVDDVGRRSASRGKSAVSFDKAFGLYTDVARRGLLAELSAAAATTVADDASTWWQDNSSAGLFAPIGQKGARDAAILAFDSKDQAGALLVGRPGSGKSTLLHTYIAALTTLYGPGELELYLIDFKEGVEFKSYAEEGLPHARVVAIESDREFGLSVLQSLRDEVSRRGELMRATGGKQTGLQALREARAQALPRILLVFDEFQVLFARNDKVGLSAAGLVETIIRQGRSFGIHVLLSSQSLSGLDALGAHVPQLLPTRILLPATETDARRVLGENNDAAQYLTSHGEGILNPAGGAVEFNERFTGALLTEQDRTERLRRLREKADSLGFVRRPTVFEGNVSVPLDRISPALFREELASSGAAPIRLRVGSPMTTSRAADVHLRREAGGNVLAVIRDGLGDGVDPAPDAGPAYGLLTAAVASAATGDAQIDIIDFLPVDDGLDEILEPFLEHGRVTLRRRRALAGLVQALAEEVHDRIDSDDTLRHARMLFLFGIHRARELDSEFASVDADAQVSDALELIMREGPEVGVHVWLWADTVGGATKRLSSRMMRECSWRIAGKMSADDSLALLGSERVAEVRDRQLVLCNDDAGIVTRAMTFAVPDRNWLIEVVQGPSTAGRR